MTTEAQHKALIAYARQQSRNGGIASLPELAPFRERLRALSDEERALGEEITRLTRQRRMTATADVQSVAKALATTGKSADPLPLRELDDELTVKRRRGEALRLAKNQVHVDVARDVRLNAVAYEAKAEAHRRSQRMGLEEAIDNLLTRWMSYAEAEADIAWIRNGGTGRVASGVPRLTLDANPDLPSLGRAMHAAIAERPAARSTVDEHGTSRTGWEGWGRAVRGEVSIGDMRSGVAGRARAAAKAAR